MNLSKLTGVIFLTLGWLNLSAQNIVLNVLDPLSISGIYPHTNQGDGSGWGLSNLLNPADAVLDTIVMMDDGDPNTNNSYGYNFPQSYCGCDSVGVMNSSVDFEGKIVLISRGSCEFGFKAYLAQLRGAVGVIIYNAFLDSDPSGGLVNISGGSYGMDVTIPVAFVANGNGIIIKNQLDLGQNVIAFLGNKKGSFQNDLAIHSNKILVPEQLGRPYFLTTDSSKFKIPRKLWVFNEGSSNQTSIKCKSIVSLNGIVLGEDSVSSSINSGDSTLLFFQNFSLPTYALGQYKIEYQVELPGIQEALDFDNYAQIGFTINEESLCYVPIDENKNFIENKRVKPSSFSYWGQAIHYKTESNMKLEGVRFSASMLNYNSISGQTLDIAVYEWSDFFYGLNDPGLSTSTLSSNPIAVETYTFSGNYQDSTLLHYFLNPIALDSNKRYVIAIISANSDMYLSFSNDYYAFNDQESNAQPVDLLMLDGTWYENGWAGYTPNIQLVLSSNTITSGCSDFFFSEYIEGSSNNKALEIYNPTSSLKSIGGYSITLFSNGAVTSTNSFTFPAGTYLQPFGTYVIGTGSAGSGIISLIDTTYPYPNVVSYNGDDAVVLFSPSGDTLDIIGIVGVDPGSNWAVGSGATNEHTLVRKANVNSGQLDWSIGATEWDVYPQNTFTQLGAHTSTCGSIVVYDRISDFTTVDSNGVADSLNANAHFTGTVFTDDFDNNSGYNFYLHDGSGGINVFKSVDVLGYGTPNRGDSIEIFGSIIQYYGLTEIVPDSIYLLKQAASLPAVRIINALGEEQESELVRLNGVHLVNPSQWTNAGGGFNVDVTDGTTNNVVRIRSGSSLYGKPAPTGIFDVIGAGSQFDVSNPYTSGYQMWPRDTNDIIPRPVQITFQVDLSNQPVNQTKGVHIAGTFNGWQPNITQMSDLDGDGIYSVTIGLVAGDTTVQYKFINGNSWSDPHDQVSGNCSVNALGDRWLSVPWMDDTIPAVHLSSCTILSPIDVLTDNQPLICSGDTIILDATNTVWNVVWSTGDTTQSIAVTQPGKYWFSANYYAGTPGISVFDTTSVAFHEPTQVIAGSDLDICNGDSVLLSASYPPIVVATIDSSFSVQSPVNIAGNYLNTIPTISSSGWGTLTYTSITDTIVLMNDGASGINTAYGYQFPESLCGCDSLGVVSNADLAGKIVLISRGSCEFGRKAYYAQLAGASGVIIYNALPDSASGGGTVIMAPGAVGSLVTIPTTFVANGTGLLIKSNLNQVGTNYTWSNGVVNGSYFKPTFSVSLTVIGYDINGCVSYDTLNINVKAAADTSVTASGNLSFCSGSSVTLSAASGQSYLWNTGDTSQTLLTSQSGFYYAVVTTSNGCSDTTATYTTTLLADPDTSVAVAGSLSFCPGGSVTLSAASGQSYLWSNGDTAQSITTTQSGTYYAIITTADGCSDTTAQFSTTAFVGPNTTITASQTTICASDSTVITAAAGYSYLWNTGDTTQSITTSNAGTYSVTLTTSDGCIDYSAPMVIAVVPDIVLPQIIGNTWGWFGQGDTTNLSTATNTSYTLSWVVNGGTILSGQGTDNIQVVWGGPDSNAVVWLYIDNGACMDSTSIQVIISGIGTDERAIQDIRLFPNPNDGFFTIQVGEAFVGGYYEIIDGMGRPIDRGEIQSQTQDFDLANKPKGVYRITLTGKSANKTMVVVLQ